MSYCIEYNPELNRKYPSIKRIRRKPPMKILILLAVFVSTYILVQSGYIKYLLPGNPDVTISAFSALVEQVGDGEPVKDAFIEFCEEIIANGY